MSSVMLRIALWVALLAGCYAPQLDDGGACSVACPGDQVCLDGRCHIAGTVPSDSDQDSDGIADAADNCAAVANDDQHDEDADGLGDVCDVCPVNAGIALDSEGDGDGDGVGDACDPQPGLGKQRVAVFAPLTHTPPSWLVGAKYVQEADSLLAKVDGTSGSHIEIPVPTNALRIVIEGEVLSVAPTGPHKLSVAFGIGTGTDQFHYVEVYDDAGAGNSPAVMIERYATGQGFIALARVPLPDVLPLGPFKFMVDESVANQSIKFSAFVGGTTHLLTASTSQSAPPLIAGTKAQILVYNAVVRLNYVYVVETTP
jgi:Thrombospondin type 3 repeat